MLYKDINPNKLDLTNKKAFLIDCDNTLGETMSSHNKAYELAFALNNVPFNLEEHEKWAPYGGKTLIQETVVNKGFSHLADDIVKDKQKLLPICLKKFMKPNKILIDFIKENKDLKFYVVSNGRRNSITEVLNILGITYFIDGLITPELVQNAKPHPDLYLKAMELAELKPEDVVVFEDNEIGIEAATKAGVTDIVHVDTTKF
ncbi:HAD-superfamily hydrolase [Bacillus phage G]|uniref:Gp310 n=1 Tax=Bacillus phage G TaxID=2884420 RepID=G3MA51_9CAUD|nr:HAD-superfamily hydrolase [Bacillus phage G]AEO93569.1 gp310 [Bacillus phage G]